MNDSDIYKRVRVAVGFSTKTERSRSIDGTTKTVAHQVNTPWQLILTSTRRAIKREDKLDQYNKSHSKMGSLFDLSDYEVGMRPWIDWYDEWTAIKAKDQGKNSNGNLPHQRVQRYIDRLERIGMEDMRYALFIERYTDDEQQATEWLGQPAKDGWNKNGKHVVILNGREPVVDTDWLNGHLRWSFGPIGTAWLAAMAPRATDRVLVIQHAIKMLKAFYIDDDISTPKFTGSLRDRERRMEWYAFHTLRRMFRLRFGCSMVYMKNAEKAVEIRQPLDEVRTSEDAGFMQYKKELQERLKELAEK